MLSHLFLVPLGVTGAANAVNMLAGFNGLPVGLCQLIMQLANGISERALVLVLMGVEAVFGLLAVLFYVRF